MQNRNKHTMANLLKQRGNKLYNKMMKKTAVETAITATPAPSSLEQLPDEMLVNIFSYLTPQALSLVAATNKRLRAVSEDDGLWKRHCDDKPKEGESYKSQVISRKKADYRFFSSDKQARLRAKVLLVGSLHRKTNDFRHYMATQEPDYNGIDIDLFYHSREGEILTKEQVFKLKNKNKLTIEYCDLHCDQFAKKREKFKPYFEEHAKNVSCVILCIGMDMSSSKEVKEWIDYINAVCRKENPNLIIAIVGQGSLLRGEMSKITEKKLKKLATTNNITHYYPSLPMALKSLNQVIIERCERFSNENKLRRHQPEEQASDSMCRVM